MGWFWDTNSGSDTGNDPYKKLDPALRDFLEKESPLKYEDTKPKQSSPSAPNASSTTYSSQLGWEDPSISRQQKSDEQTEDRPAVPPQSLFQDGRYAHLWKGYRPQADVEAAGRSEPDRLAAVVEAYQDRKAAIGRAALENCVELQIAEKDCFTNGDWARRMTMCREEHRDFNRCYSMQSRFLKALGYLASQRTEEEEERIQMHADKLYHEMLRREQAAQEAKEQGLQEPELPPLIQPDATTQALGVDSAWAQARRKAMEAGMPNTLSSYSPERQQEITKRIQGLSKEQKELELQLIAAENRAQMEYAEQIKEHMEEERRHRADRRERGKETMGDTIKRLWGWEK